MIKRLLIYFTNKDEIPFLADFTGTIREKSPEMDISGIYVKNLDDYMKYNSAMYSDAYYQDFLQTWKEIEEKKNREISEVFDKYFPGGAYFCRDGYSEEVILDELRTYDLLVLAKPPFINREVKALLSKHHKPLILVPPEGPYRMDKVLLADDERLEANRAFFCFLNLFDHIKTFKALAVNVDKDSFKDLNIYLEKVGKSIEYDFREGHPDEFFREASTKNDLLIMGDLKHSFLVERLGGKAGLKILENTEIPLFIA